MRQHPDGALLLPTSPTNASEEEGDPPLVVSALLQSTYWSHSFRPARLLPYTLQLAALWGLGALVLGMGVACVGGRRARPKRKGRCRLCPQARGVVWVLGHLLSVYAFLFYLLAVVTVRCG